MGRGWSGQWAARAVPELRREMAAEYEATATRTRDRLARLPAWTLAATGVEGQARELIDHSERMAFALRGADLFWVTGDMLGQALDASQDMPGFATADLPVRNGLALFERPAPDLDTGPLALKGGIEWRGWVPVWGLWWHGHDAETLRVRALTRIAALPHPMTGDCELQEAISLPVPRARGMIFDEISDVFGEGWVPVDRGVLGVLALLGAMSVLMVTPTVTERRVVDARSGRAPVEGRTRPDDLVRTLDLRPLRSVDVSDSGEPGVAREYRHRWVVRGHWRQQPHGPGREQRRLQYIAPYIKGPPDAPLLAAEKVWVWRR